jgi:hypothetical protein
MMKLEVRYRDQKGMRSTIDLQEILFEAQPELELDLWSTEDKAMRRKLFALCEAILNEPDVKRRGLVVGLIADNFEALIHDIGVLGLAQYKYRR